MPIREYEFYHGAVLLRMTQNGGISTKISVQEDIARGCYLINGRSCLYVKHSAKRMPPWSFTFHDDHIGAIRHMRRKFPRSFAVFVCHDDGIAVVETKDVLSILGANAPAWIRISRTRRGMYVVGGTDGVLERRIANEEFSPIFQT